MRIIAGDLDDQRVIDLLRTHVATAQAETAEGSAHSLDLDGLRTPDIDFWTIWTDDALLGMGALRRLSADHGEVKSMHVVQAMRGLGAGSAMLRHLIERARGDGLARLSLETGSWPYFFPAHALYRRHGFTECPAFGDYAPDPNSLFFSLELAEI